MDIESDDEESSRSPQFDEPSLKSVIQGEGVLSEEQLNETVQVLNLANIKTRRDLAAFPVDKISTIKSLKPKSRALLKALIPKLNGMLHSTNSYLILY